MNNKKSRTWTLILVANVVMAVSTGWSIFSKVVVIINALYVLMLIVKQLKEGV